MFVHDISPFSLVLSKPISLVTHKLSGHLSRVCDLPSGRESNSQTARFVQTRVVTGKTGGEMMQADTVTTPTAARTTAESQRAAGPIPRGLKLGNVNPDYTASFWRLVPVLFGLAAWLPQIWTSLASFSRAGIGPTFENAGGGFIESNVVKFVGPDGLVVVGAAIAAGMAYAIWALARAVGAPRWAAATAASISVVSPLFGFAPSPILSPDDALFGVFMTLALAGVVWAARRDDSNCLMIAFILAIIAAIVRPGAAWPAIAIGVAALMATNKLEEGPLLGMFSSLCWAPGLYFARKIFGGDSDLPSLAPEPSVLDATRDVAAKSMSAADNAAMSLPAILNGLLSGVPFVIFGLTAIIGCTILFLLGKSRRRGAIAGAVGAAASIIGAAGYGDFEAARLLLDPIFLGLGASVGLILPALISRLKTPPVSSGVSSARV
jgi:hypothetical protein